MVKCADCGFPVVKKRDDTTLVSPGIEQRETGQAPTVLEATSSPLIMDLPILETKPRCSYGALPIDEEYEKGKPAGSPQWSLEGIKTAKAVMQRERTCQKFTKWIQGAHPEGAS